MLCFLDTVQTPGIALRVSLTDILQQPTSVAPLTSVLQDQNQIDLTDAIVEEAPLCENPPTLTFTAPYTTFIAPDENPFNITDAEIDEMLKVLEGGSVFPNQTSVNVDHDEDLERVLSMDVGDFIV